MFKLKVLGLQLPNRMLMSEKWWTYVINLVNNSERDFGPSCLWQPSYLLVFLYPSNNKCWEKGAENEVMAAFSCLWTQTHNDISYYIISGVFKRKNKRAYQRHNYNIMHSVVTLLDMHVESTGYSFPLFVVL